MNYGICKFCGAPNTQSRVTGKIYCSEKCWLDNPQQQRYDRPARQFQPQKPEPNWRAIRQEKTEDIRANVLLKEACEFTRAMYQKGEIKADQIISAVARMFGELKEISDVEELEKPKEYPNEEPPEE